MRDISLLAAGEGGENDVDYLLKLAAGADDSDAMEDVVAGVSESAFPARRKLVYDNLIHVFVGPRKKIFEVHTELFRSISPYVASVLTGEARERERRRLQYARHKLQKMFFPQKGHAGAKQLAAADGLVQKLEGLGDLYAENIKTTRIHKLLKAALTSSDVPSIEQWKLKKRIHILLTKYERRLEAVTTTEDAAAETPDNTISLPQVAEDTFAIFQHWLYQHQLTSPHIYHRGEYGALTAEELVELYTLADRLGTTPLQNEIVDKLELISPTAEVFRRIILHVFSNPTTEGKLQRLILTMYAQHTTAANMRQAAGDWLVKEVVVELAAVLLEEAAKNKGMKLASKSSGCEYHVHNKANPSCTEEDS